MRKEDFIRWAMDEQNKLVMREFLNKDAIKNILTKLFIENLGPNNTEGANESEFKVLLHKIKAMMIAIKHYEETNPGRSGISITEFEDFIKHHRISSKKKGIREIFDSIDIDKSNRISCEEYMF